MRRVILVASLGSGLGCGSSSAVPPVPLDAGAPLDAPDRQGAGPGGGKLPELRFAVVGDTRPANLDDTAGYPTEIVRQIWSDVEAEAPHAQFAVTTGDYMFASASTGDQVDPQLDLYLGARATFHGLVYPALGNHECTGYTKSNCGAANADRTPRNYTAFLERMIAPIGETLPYYVERFAAEDGSWTAKIVFVAANAWDSNQAAWFENALGEPTTYTFVVRHEGHDADAAPGVDPSAIIMAKHPLTLLIVGHTHAYRHYPAVKEIVVGNGGAPLSSATNYGYVIVARNPDGSIGVTSSEYVTHALVEHFSVTTDGAIIP